MFHPHIWVVWLCAICGVLNISVYIAARKYKFGYLQPLYMTFLILGIVSQQYGKSEFMSLLLIPLAFATLIFWVRKTNWGTTMREQAEREKMPKDNVAPGTGGMG